MSVYWHQNTINGDHQSCSWALFSSCFDLLALPLSLMGIWHDTILLTLGFLMSKSFESSCPVTSWQPILPSSERLCCLHSMSTVTSRISRHFNYYIMLHHLFWSILIEVVPGLIWMRADMAVYQPGNFLYNLSIKKNPNMYFCFHCRCRLDYNSLICYKAKQQPRDRSRSSVFPRSWTE